MFEQSEQETVNEEENFEANHKNNLANVVYTSKPINTVLHFYGIFVFRIVDGELKPPTWQMKIFGIMFSVAYMILYIGTLNLPSEITEDTELVDTADEIPGLVLLFQFVTSSIITTFLLNTTYASIMYALSEIDTVLHVEPSTKFYKKSHTQSVQMVITLLVTHTINSVADIVTADDVDINISSIVDLPLHFYQKLQVLAFIKMILMLKSRLILINNYLKTFNENQDKTSVTIFTIRDTKITADAKLNFIGRASESNLKIRDLATMYDLIGKISLMINEVFNYQIFMTLVSTFVFIVITMWSTLYYYRTPEGNSGSLITIAIWCFSSIYTVAAMSCVCEQLLSVRNESKILVNKVIMNYDLPKIMRVQAKAFMELIDAWPLRIYIYDMFSVDITLMLKFISVATTYLIVIIQISHFV